MFGLRRRVQVRDDVLSELRQLTDRLTDALERNSEHRIQMNVQSVQVDKVTLDQLLFRLDRLDVEDLSGALNLGNNFGTDMMANKVDRKSGQSHHLANQASSAPPNKAPSSSPYQTSSSSPNETPSPSKDRVSNPSSYKSSDQPSNTFSRPASQVSRWTGSNIEDAPRDDDTVRRTEKGYKVIIPERREQGP